MIAPIGFPPRYATKAEDFRRKLPANHPARRATNPCAVDKNDQYWTAVDAAIAKEEGRPLKGLTCADCGGVLILSSRGDLPYFRHMNRTDVCIKRVNETPNHWAIKTGFLIFDGWQNEYVVRQGILDAYGENPHQQVMVEVICSGGTRYAKRQKLLDEQWPELMQVYLFDSAGKLATRKNEEYFEILEPSDPAMNLRRLVARNLLTIEGIDLVETLGPRRCYTFYAGNIWFTTDGKSWEMVGGNHWLTAAVHRQHGILQKMRLYNEQRESANDEIGGTVAPRIRYRDPRYKLYELPPPGVDTRAGLFKWIEEHPEFLVPEERRRPIRTGAGSSEPQKPACDDPEKELVDPEEKRDAIAEMHELTEATGSPSSFITLGDIGQDTDEKGRVIAEASPAVIEIEKEPVPSWLPAGAIERGIPHPSKFDPDTFDYEPMKRQLREGIEINNFVILKIESCGGCREYSEGTRLLQMYGSIGGYSWPFGLFENSFLASSFSEAVGKPFDDLCEDCEDIQGLHVVAAWGRSSQSGFYGPRQFWHYEK